MNKALALQRSKLNTSYGGVGSTIDTIDNLSYMVEPFDKWPIYEQFDSPRSRRNVNYLLHSEERLLERIKRLGFHALEEFFLTETFEGEDIEPWRLTEGQKKRMVSATYFPRMFYCPVCHELKSIEDWQSSWELDKNWSDRVPKCPKCSRRAGNKVFGPNLVQVRFVLASMETGDIRDLPWGMLYAKKGKSDESPGVWRFNENPGSSEYIQPREVTFSVASGSSDLIDIYVKSGNTTMNMAVIMKHYFVITDRNGSTSVYRPVIKSANNVYFAYTLKSVYVPVNTITQDVIDRIQNMHNDDMKPKQIAAYGNVNLSESEIETLIKNDFVVPKTDYSTEEMFRLDEFLSLTKEANYRNGVFQDTEGRLRSEKYNWTNDISYDFIKGIYLLKKINVTSALLAYSRIDKISLNHLGQWRGQSERPKLWYDHVSNQISPNIQVALHPTCDSDKNNIKRIPVVSSYGEGFFIELDFDSMPKNEIHREVFLHTFAHLIMKSLEFHCGYPIASMSERLYVLPHSKTGCQDKYGFMIYSANGEAGSYGGITTLFETGEIEKIIIQAVKSAGDCSNDPICEDEGGSCFACVQIPETACEMFNTKLSRNVISSHFNGTFESASNASVSSKEEPGSQDDDDILA